MPRGRGRGRWATRGSGRGGSRGRGGASKISPRSNRTNRVVTSASNGQYYGNINNHEVHAIFEPPGLLIVAGLQPHQFPDYEFDPDQDEDDDEGHESDSHSDYGSNKTPKKHPSHRLLQEADLAQHHSSKSGNDDDWTETEVEVLVSAKTRGFYRPPPKREVIRKRVKKEESSRYNDVVPRITREDLSEDVDNAADAQEDDMPSRRSSQRSNQLGEGLPVVVEEHATPEEDEGNSRRRTRRTSLAQILEAPKPQKRKLEIIDEGELSDSNFPEGLLARPPTPPEAECDDHADYIMKKQFAPMGDPQAFVTALTKLDPSRRSTEVLYALAANAQKAIRAWQDEYLLLDLKTAPASNPPKKALTGGRPLIDPDLFENLLEADLYGYNYDHKKLVGHQNPFTQRTGAGKLIGGRELRQRRGRDVGAVDLSDNEASGIEGYGTRRRRAAQRQNDLLQVPPRGVKRVNTPSDYDGPPRKRGRPSAADKMLMQSRVQQLRGESMAPSTVSDADGRSPEPARRRGRPPGSKNTQPRSDAGIKKGPRKSRLTSVPLGSETGSQMEGIEETPAPEPMTMPPIHDPMVIDYSVTSQPNGGAAYRSEPERPPVFINGEGIVPSTEPTPTTTQASTPAPPLDSLKDKDPKKRVRSEKRSKSMTEWWAARKAKEAEDKKLKMAQQTEMERAAGEHARVHLHPAHQGPPPMQDPRYWQQIAPQQPPHYQIPPPQLPQHLPPQHQPYPPQHPQLPPGYLLGPPPPQMIPLQHVQHAPGRRRGPPPILNAELQPASHTQSMQPPSPSRPTTMQPTGAPPGPPPASYQSHPPLQGPPQQEAQYPGPPPQPPQSQPPPSSLPSLPPQMALLPQGLSHPPGPPALQQQIPLQHHHLYRPPSGPPPPPILHHPPPPPNIHHDHAPSRPRSTSLASSPPQQQLFFHSHSAPHQPPTLQAPPQFSSHSGPLPPRQPSPLRRIPNYISDPSKAAQPSGPPYQSIMAPGATSPTIILQNARPGSRGANATSPTAVTPGRESTFISYQGSRNAIPGTGSFKPTTPVRASFASNGGKGRMTGAQVQDLALKGVQPVVRKSLEDVMKAQHSEERPEERKEAQSSELPPPPAAMLNPFPPLQPQPATQSVPQGEKALLPAPPSLP